MRTRPAKRCSELRMRVVRFDPMAQDIFLQLPSREDAPGLLEAVRESLADLIPWMEWATEAYDLATALRWIEGQQAKREKAEAFEYLIKDRHGEILGGCGIN